MSGLDAVLARSPLQLLSRRRARRRLTVLAYHAVTDPACFERHLDHLLAVVQPVSLATVLDTVTADAETARTALPPAAVLVTFDDGDRTVLEAALPRLEARGIPAAVFVVSGLVDGDRPPWWREVEELSAAGGRCRALPELSGRPLVAALKGLADRDRRLAIAELRETAGRPIAAAPQLTSADLRRLEAGGVAVGNHTASHPCLDRCDTATLGREIRRAHDELTLAIGHPPRAFAFPNGNFDPRAEPVLAELGYGAAFLFDHRPQQLPVERPFAVSRVRVNSDTPLDRFKILLSGLHPALHRARGRS